MTDMTKCKTCGHTIQTGDYCSDCKVVAILRQEVLDYRIDQELAARDHNHMGQRE